MCLYPIPKKVPPNANCPEWRVISIPCGKCVDCKKKYQNSITIRIIEELKCWSKSSFVTLTYSEANLPQYVNPETGETHGTLVKEHFQKWLKRFRSAYYFKYKKKPKFKYFLCGEYGPRTFRPHAHVIFFGLDRLELNDAIADWQNRYGFVDYEKIDLTSTKSLANTGRYIGKYSSKGVFENPLVELGLVAPTFRLMSKGLGLSYIEKNKKYHLSGNIDDITDKYNYCLNGVKYSLPRYYKTKIYGEKSRLQYKIANTLLSRNDELYNKKLASLQKSANDSAPVNEIYLQEINAHRLRDIETEKRYESFLNKSKI